MSDPKTTPEQFFFKHCEGKFEGAQQERGRILELVGEVSENAQAKREEILGTVGDIKKKVYNGFGREIEVVDKKVDGIRRVLLGVGAAVGVAILALVGDLIHDNIKARGAELSPAVVKQLEELVRNGGEE